MTTPRILAIIGSGETAPTMSSVHAELFEQMGDPSGTAVMLDTPFGFQENADEIAQRSVAYFRDSTGRNIEVATFRDAETATPYEYERMCSMLASASWVFAGPGSPTYAVRQWRGTRVPELLAQKLREGGVVVFSSAAAVGLGELAIPVYEVYKVGMAPHWVDGLDLVRHTGLRAVVVPHYNNAEGGTHDTRFCYMGERRLRKLEEMLPAGCAVLGVDEHTACILDVGAATMTVRGRGRVHWRSEGAEAHWAAGDVVPLAEVAAGGGAGAVDLRADATGLPPPQAEPAAADGASPFMEEVMAGRATALAALRARDPDTAAGAILDVETAVHEWSRDTLQSDEPDRARQTLRELVVGLAQLARSGTADPRERVAPLVDALLALRDGARRDRRFDDADRIRDAVTAAGVEIHDTPQGTTWEVTEATARV